MRSPRTLSLLYCEYLVNEVNDRGLMAQLPEETITVVLELQRRLLKIIHQAEESQKLSLQRTLLY